MNLSKNGPLVSCFDGAVWLNGEPKTFFGVESDDGAGGAVRLVGGHVTSSAVVKRGTRFSVFGASMCGAPLFTPPKRSVSKCDVTIFP